LQINNKKQTIMDSKKLFVPLALFVLMGMFATVSFGCWTVPQDKGTGDFTKEERNVGSFSKLDVGGAFTVYLTQGSQEKLVVEADAEEIKEIVTEVVGSTLKIYTKSNWGTSFHDMTIYLTFKDLSAIDFSGAVEVKSEGELNFTALQLDVSGAAEIDMAMKADRFEAEFSGASEVELSGTCNRGYFELSGASEFNAENLEFKELSIDVSGASDAKVWSTGTLNIDASGASSIRYKGNPPNITIDESGASSVKPL
jgi:hypothetical protein